MRGSARGYQKEYGCFAHAQPHVPFIRGKFKQSKAKCYVHSSIIDSGTLFAVDRRIVERRLQVPPSFTRKGIWGGRIREGVDTPTFPVNYK